MISKKGCAVISTIIFLSGWGIFHAWQYGVEHQQQVSQNSGIYSGSFPIIEPLSLNFTGTICDGLSKCYDTKETRIDGGVQLYSPKLNSTINIVFYEYFNGKFIPSVGNFCNSDICFESDNYKIVMAVIPLESNTYLDSISTKLVNKRIISLDYFDIDNDHMSEFVYMVEVADHSDKQALKENPFNFRIITVR